MNIEENKIKEKKANEWVAQGFYMAFGAGLALILYGLIIWGFIYFIIKYN